ncbi:MAG: DUF4974 domain-containing protein [Muribaculaceae bacterium]|nr:DUF4974 domain-containing protein [Muribaculaceae bacterium]
MNEDTINEYEQLIARYLASEATDEEIARLEEWVGRSDENMRIYSVQKNIWDNLHAPFSPDEIDLDEATRKILSATGSGESQRKNPLKHILNIWKGVAAILFIPLLVLTVYLFSSKEDKTGENPVMLYAAYGSRVETILPDGSKVWLNANSTLSYPQEFASDKREVELAGEGYFQVESDRSHPFLVKTKDFIVEAYGTEFNVNSYQQNALQQSVTLVKGNVDVTINSGNSYQLSPGEHLTYSDGKIKIHSNAEVGKYCCWKEGALNFNDNTLGEIFTRLSEIYDVEFDVRNPEIESYRYHATFEGESLEEILKLIEMSGTIEVKEISGKSGRKLYQVKKI